MKMQSPVHIIAEAGTNHNGKVDQGKALIDLAAEASADTVKFQIINPDLLYLPGNYVFGKYDINKVRDMRKQFMLTDSEYRSLAEYAKEKKVPFTASVFDEIGIELYMAMEPEYIKIASTDLNNIRLLRKVIEQGKRIILSTGMSSLADIEKSVNEITKAGFEDLVLMHCVSSYPAHLEYMNLNFIDALTAAFGFPVALSDHSQNSIAACIALTKGISYIEKHITIDRSLEGFDHTYACEGNKFIEYVNDIRLAEKALTTQIVKTGESEAYVRTRARRALYAARDIAEGEMLKDEDVLVLRPSNVMASDEIDKLVGQKLGKSIKQYEPFSPDMV